MGLYDNFACGLFVQCSLKQMAGKPDEAAPMASHTCLPGIKVNTMPAV